MEEGLADDMCAIWTSFARDGNPGTDKVEWTQYTPENRETLVIGNDGSLEMENDPKSEQTKRMMPFAYDYLK